MSGYNGAAEPKRWSMESQLLDPSNGQKSQPPQFPGWEGLPFRGKAPDLKSSDPAHMQPRVAATAHVEVLVLSETKDLARYEEISQMVTNGYAVISFEERIYDKDIKNWRVLVRWGDLFAYNPEEGHNSGRSI